VAGAPLRLVIPPFALPVAGPALAAEDSAAGRGSLDLDLPDGETVLAWRVEDSPPALHLSTLKAPAATGGAPAPVASPERHWSSLPFLGEQARQAGYELPLPFGVSAVYNYVARDIEVKDVRIGVNGAPLTSVSQVANFKARSFANAAVVKTDAWLFPFLDVYLLLSYIHNSSDTKHRGHGVEAAPFVPTSAFQGCFGP
jgi:hypothetical protein